MRLQVRWTVLCLVVMLIMTAGTWASAQEEEQEPDEALVFYEHAQELYAQGRYREAVEELERARALDPNAPELLYNIALVYERLNDFDSALRYLEMYLRFDLPAEERGRVEGVIARIRGAQSHSGFLAPRTVTRVLVQRRGLADGIFWGFVGASLAAGVGTLITGVMALRYRNEANGFVVGPGNQYSEFEWVRSSARRFGVATDILWATGAACALTALLLYVLRVRSVEPADEEITREEGDGEEESVPTFGDDSKRLFRPRLTVGLAGASLGWEF